MIVCLSSSLLLSSLFHCYIEIQTPHTRKVINLIIAVLRIKSLFHCYYQDSDPHTSLIVIVAVVVVVIVPLLLSRFRPPHMFNRHCRCRCCRHCSIATSQDLDPPHTCTRSVLLLLSLSTQKSPDLEIYDPRHFFAQCPGW